MEQSTHNKSTKHWLNSSEEKKNSDLLREFESTVKHIANIIGSAKRVFVGAHEHPDGDALGSTLALVHALKAQGKEVVGHIPDPPADFFAFLPGIESLVTTPPTDLDKYDLLILLDSTQFARTHVQNIAASHPQTIVIDHHKDNTREGTDNLVVPDAAATIHILFELFVSWDWDITPDIATCLLTGIFTDTGSFMHDSVTPGILTIASELMQKGARLSHIAHETYQKKDLAGLKIWGRALTRIMTNETTGAAMSVITYKDLEECGANRDDLDGVVNMLNTIPDSKFALLLTEHTPGKIKGSLRSEPHKGVDVSNIAKRLGGGGHKLAAGFEVDGHLVQKGGKWHIASGEKNKMTKSK